MSQAQTAHIATHSLVAASPMALAAGKLHIYIYISYMSHKCILYIYIYICKICCYASYIYIFICATICMSVHGLWKLSRYMTGTNRNSLMLEKALYTSAPGAKG